MELCEQQRQQAIRDLEALLQPGVLEARIEQVCLKVLVFSAAVFSNREVKRTTFFNFSCKDFIHLPVFGCNPFVFFECSDIQFRDTCIYLMHTMLSVLQSIKLLLLLCDVCF